MLPVNNYITLRVCITVHCIYTGTIQQHTFRHCQFFTNHLHRVTQYRINIIRLLSLPNLSFFSFCLTVFKKMEKKKQKQDYKVYTSRQCRPKMTSNHYYYQTPKIWNLSLSWLQLVSCFKKECTITSILFSQKI